MTALAIVLAAALALTLSGGGFLLAERRRLRRELVLAREERDRAHAEAREVDGRADGLAQEVAAFKARAEEAERREQEEQRRLEKLREQFRAMFDELASKALDAQSKRFLELAQQSFQKHKAEASADLEKKQKAVDDLLRPIRESLQKQHEVMGQMEKTRTEAYAGLLEQVKAMQQANEKLGGRADDLVRALRKPQVRGRYGEIQLERVVELAGMRSYCDFDTQHSVRDENNRLLRPDMVVKLPNDRLIVVDAKCNIEAYLDAIECDDPAETETHLDRFARHMCDQAGALSKKEYWEQFEGSPEFVVMFVPGDQFVDAALARRPELLDLAAQQRVIIASPSTLIGLLRAVHVGWREKSLSDSAGELFELGRELHDRVGKVVEHIGSLGNAIEAAQKRYNSLVGSVDARLMPTLRKFEEKGAASSKRIAELSKLDGGIREPDSLPSPDPAPGNGDTMFPVGS